MKLKNDYELVGQMLRQKFEESGHNVFTVAHGIVAL